MKKKIFLLPCIAAVAIATFVGAKSFQTNAYESNDLLLQNVEALSAGSDASGSYVICYSESKVRKGWTYYNCGTCEQVYDEQGKKTYSKCFY